MTPNNFQNEDKLIQSLKKSAADFRFDSELGKTRLLTSLNSLEVKQPLTRIWYVKVTKYTLGSIIGIVLLSATFSYASNAKPGDKLFALNKLGEQVILNLPLSASQKAHVEEHIVTSRLDALNAASYVTESKKLETIKESDETLQTAITDITNNKNRLNKAGKTDQVKKLDAVLNSIQSQVEKSEPEIQNLEDQTKDQKIKQQIHNHHQKIKSSGNKAKKEQENNKED